MQLGERDQERVSAGGGGAGHVGGPATGGLEVPELVPALQRSLLGVCAADPPGQVEGRPGGSHGIHRFLSLSRWWLRARDSKGVAWGNGM
ncbi:hypothetical protein GCM10009642_18330 [Nocardiopsis metallicus]